MNHVTIRCFFCESRFCGEIPCQQICLDTILHTGPEHLQKVMHAMSHQTMINNLISQPIYRNDSLISETHWYSSTHNRQTKTTMLYCRLKYLRLSDNLRIFRVFDRHRFEGLLLMLFIPLFQGWPSASVGKTIYLSHLSIQQHQTRGNPIRMFNAALIVNGTGR